MILEFKQSVIYLTKDKLFYIGKNKKIAGVIEYVWPNLNEALEKLKQVLGDTSCHLILSDKFIYIFNFSSHKEAKKREVVLRKLKTMMPEEVSDKTFDWAVINGQVQLIAASNEIYDKLKSSFKKMGLKIISCQPVCTLLTENTLLVDKDVLIVFDGQEKLAILAKRGVVYDRFQLKEIVKEEVIQAVQKINELEEIQVQAIMLFTIDEKFNLDIGEGYDLTRVIVDPYKLILESNLIGKDEKILSIKFHQALLPEKELPKLIVALIIMVVGVLIVGAILYLIGK